MTNQNDARDESAPRDPLADRLHREALAERPPFSPDLHREILRHLREGKPIINKSSVFRPTRWLAVAATILLALAIADSFISRPHPTPTPVALNIQPAPNAPSNAPFPTSLSISLNLGGELSANLWPPQISITLPTAGDSSPQNADTSEPAPQPLAGFPDPAASAQAALADIVPPNFRTFAIALRDATHLPQ